MIFLSGCVIQQRHANLGFILTPRMRQRIPSGAQLAADNNCFSAPEYYSDERYHRFLRKMPRDRTLFATAPDVLGSHAATVRRSVEVCRSIRSFGHHAAFVAQDGWDEETTPWEEFDVLFVGGTDKFKFNAGRAAVAAAQRHGKRVHMGRINSFLRFQAAAAMGCDSCDGTFMRYGPRENWRRLQSWLEWAGHQLELPLDWQQGSKSSARLLF